MPSKSPDGMNEQFTPREIDKEIDLPTYQYTPLSDLKPDIRIIGQLFGDFDNGTHTRIHYRELVEPLPTAIRRLTLRKRREMLPADGNRELGIA